MRTHCCFVCALLVEGRGVGSTPTLPHASPLWPCRDAHRRLGGGLLGGVTWYPSQQVQVSLSGAGIPLRCRYPSQVQVSLSGAGIPLRCRYPSQVQVSLSGAGIPLRCRYPSQVQVSLSGAGIPLRCRYPSQVQVSLSGAGIPLRCRYPSHVQVSLSGMQVSLSGAGIPLRCRCRYPSQVQVSLSGAGIPLRYAGPLGFVACGRASPVAPSSFLHAWHSLLSHLCLGPFLAIPLTTALSVPCWRGGAWGQHRRSLTPLPCGRAGACGDGRETAQQQIEVAALRESMGLGMASQGTLPSSLPVLSRSSFSIPLACLHSLASFPLSALPPPARLLGVQQRRLSGGDRREAALQRIAIAATRESMGMGVASQGEPFACSSALDSRSAGSLWMLILLLSLAPCAPPTASLAAPSAIMAAAGRKGAAGGQQEGSRRVAGGSNPFTPCTSFFHFLLTSLSLYSLAYVLFLISLPTSLLPLHTSVLFSPTSVPRPFLSLSQSATLSSQQVAYTGVAVAGDMECTGSTCSPPNLHTANHSLFLRGPLQVEGRGVGVNGATPARPSPAGPARTHGDGEEAALQPTEIVLRVGAQEKGRESGDTLSHTSSSLPFPQPSQQHPTWTTVESRTSSNPPLPTFQQPHHHGALHGSGRYR
ncbi:unnamed protein product [Closterium sp. NIES-65]|nr:unnamed protein product [Closterium sp. NIES-65]